MIVENPPLFAIEKSAHLLRVGNDPEPGPRNVIAFRSGGNTILFRSM